MNVLITTKINDVPTTIINHLSGESQNGHEFALVPSVGVGVPWGRRRRRPPCWSATCGRTWRRAPGSRAKPSYWSTVQTHKIWWNQAHHEFLINSNGRINFGHKIHLPQQQLKKRRRRAAVAGAGYHFEMLIPGCMRHGIGLDGQFPGGRWVHRGGDDAG